MIWTLSLFTLDIVSFHFSLFPNISQKSELLVYANALIWGLFMPLVFLIKNLF